MYERDGEHHQIMQNVTIFEWLAFAAICIVCVVLNSDFVSWNRDIISQFSPRNQAD
jgi:hypothetical protein